MRKLILLFIILITLAIPCIGQDQTVNGRNVNVVITQNSNWSTMVNQTFVMSPLGPDYGFCVSMINNNPTSSHTFSVTTFQTGDQNTSDYSHNTSRYAPLAIVGNPSPIAASSTQTFFVRSNGAAKIAFVFTGGSLQAGSPDTVDIFAVQTTASGCGTVNPQTGQQYTLATPNSGTSSAPPVMAVSDGLSQAYVSSVSVTNPASSAIIEGVINGSATKTIYFDKVIVSCATAACSLIISGITNTGTGCTSVAIGAGGNMKVNNSTASVANVLTLCTANPAQYAPFTVDLSANTTVTVDLKGFICGNGTGFDAVVAVGFTGNARANFFWYEK